MPKLMKPLIVIVLAVGVAAGAAVFLSRNAVSSPENPATPAHDEIKGGGHLRGPETAQLTLVEFGDYQCPSCGAYHPFVKEILNRYPGRYQYLNIVMTIMREGDRLFAQMSGEERDPIFAESDRDFFSKSVAVQIHFEGEDGSASALRLRGPGGELRFVRVD